MGLYPSFKEQTKSSEDLILYDNGNQLAPILLTTSGDDGLTATAEFRTNSIYLKSACSYNGSTGKTRGAYMYIDLGILDLSKYSHLCFDYTEVYAGSNSGINIIAYSHSRQFSTTLADGWSQNKVIQSGSPGSYDGTKGLAKSIALNITTPVYFELLSFMCGSSWTVNSYVNLTKVYFKHR